MSPLELSLNLQKRKKISRNCYIKNFNFVIVLLIIICLGFYAFIANNQLTREIRLKNLAEQKEEVRQKISLQSLTFHNLRTPSYIKTKTQETMVLIDKMQYIKIDDQAVAIK
jgi:hypothetical protein